MKQISLEEKVNNTLKWLANQIACSQVYHWDEFSKKENINNAWQKVQEQFKKDIDWNALTEEQCKALHFGRWQSEEDVKEEISCLQSEFEKGHLTKDEFDKKVANEKNTIGLRLIPLYLYPSLPIGITLTSIGGDEIVFDGSNINTDVRFGCIHGVLNRKMINNMEDFQKRMCEEHDELVERLSKLNAALKKEGFLQKVGEYQYKLMVKQSVGMTNYLEALEYRMADMNIDFKRRTAISLNLL